MKEIFYLEDRCVRCNSCQAACVVEHLRNKDAYMAVDEFSLAVKRANEDYINTFSGDFLPHPMRCRSCPEPKCVEACISGANCKNYESGRVNSDKQKCVGCWMCVMACPHGAMVPLYQHKKTIKCDSCLWCDIPACVMACPTKAIIYCSHEEYLSLRRRESRFMEVSKVSTIKVL
jgi:carbon-monoxide dehydrogenase iron sulfur subunit